jgi:hypothetical protein
MMVFSLRIGIIERIIVGVAVFGIKITEVRSRVGQREDILPVPELNDILTFSHLSSLSLF